MKTILLMLLALATMERASISAQVVPPPPVPVASPPPPAPNLRAIPDDNLAYPVLVLAGNTTGSGFYLTRQKEVFFVTAKHVLFDPATNQLHSPVATLISYSPDLKDSTKNVVTLNFALIQASNGLKVHKTQDVVAVKVFDGTPPVVPGPAPLSAAAGVTIASVTRAGFLAVDSNNVKSFDQVLTGNDVMVFGYPTSLGLQQFPQLDPLRPLLRKGIVAGTNPAARTLVLDCPVYFGNSGGPVLEIDRQGPLNILSIIGVVDQYVPFVQQAGGQTLSMQLQANSGYSLAVPMDYVLELIK